MRRVRILMPLLLGSIFLMWGNRIFASEVNTQENLVPLNESEFFTIADNGTISTDMLFQMRDFAGSTSYTGAYGESILVVSACRFLLSDDRKEFENTIKLLKTKHPHSDFLREIATRKFHTECSACKGGGSMQGQCASCIGSGKCSPCRGAGEREPMFDNPFSRPERCTTCKATGRCSKCGGTGSKHTACKTCRGKGKIFSRKVRNEFFSSYMANVVKDYEQDLLAIKQEEDNKLRRQSELEAIKEAKLLEAKIVAEERATQEKAIIQEEAERLRKEEEDRKYAEFDSRYLQSIVLISGDKGRGTGFLCLLNDKKVILSNAHVLLGNRQLKMQTIDGKLLEYGSIRVCKGRDIVAYELKGESELPFLKIYEDVAKMNNQEHIVVFGNSGGGQVVTTLRGQMQGIGPDKIEVDASFISGNSGSPIIAYPYEAVVGMATYATRDPEVDWTKKSTRFANVRRYGVRVDNVKREDFFLVDMEEYHQVLDIFDLIYEFANLEFEKAQKRATFKFAGRDSKSTAKRLLKLYNSTPEWMRTYADHAAIGAHVCEILCEE